MTKSDQSDPSDEKIRDDLFYNYSLNEIKSQEDFAKQLLSLNSILISIYMALILNNQGMEAIRDFSNKLAFWNGLSSPIYWVILIIPIACWLISMFYCFDAISPNIRRARSLFNDSESEYIALKSINNYKYGSLNSGFKSTMLGLGIIFIVMAFVVAYQLVGNYSDLADTGWELYGRGKVDESIQALDKSLQINPNVAVTWNMKGVVLFSEGSYDQALNAFDKALDISPNDKVIWYNKFNTLDKLGRSDEANKAKAKARELGYPISV